MLFKMFFKFIKSFNSTEIVKKLNRKCFFYLIVLFFHLFKSLSQKYTDGKLKNLSWLVKVEATSFDRIFGCFLLIFK